MKPLILAWCREGFEDDCGQEMAEAVTKVLGLRRKPVPVSTSGTAFVTLPLASVQELQTVSRRLKLRELVFSRQIAFGFGPLDLGEVRDRATPVANAAAEVLGPVTGTEFARLTVTYPDNNEGKELTRFAKLVHPALAKALGKAGFNTRAGDAPSRGANGLPLLNVFFYDHAKSAFLTWIDPANGSPWPDGVARLKFPPAAPSRSTLKLEEAFHVFMTRDQRDLLLRPGLTVVDLGASPGGWTWQFLQRQMFVTAVDNGKMDAALMATGMVDHRTEDAFKYRPKTPVDWLVCDVVEQPSRVAKLAAAWISGGLCRNLVVNLKMPMKQRHEEVIKCLETIRNASDKWHIAARQLYHDRREITVFGSSQLPR
ncbi:MAG: hypothetical protein RIQ81_2535 [Pseudomonadota bacterium]